VRENEDLKSSQEALLQERSEHQEQYFHRIKLQYNEAVLTRNIVRQMDLSLALSKAQEINLKLSAEISQKHKLAKVGAYKI
jgi:RNA-splicing ligase RtcB